VGAFASQDTPPCFFLQELCTGLLRIMETLTSTKAFAGFTRLSYLASQPFACRCQAIQQETLQEKQC